MFLIDEKRSGDVLLIDIKFAELEDDVECASLTKLTKLVKKLSNLTRIGKEKRHRLISHSLTYFVELIGRLGFHFVKSLTGLTNGLAMDGAQSKEEKVAVGFFG